MGKKKTVFNMNWIDPEISEKEWLDCLQPVKSNKYQAYCRLCLKAIELSNMGRQAIRSHFKSTGHMNRMKNKACNNNITCMFNNNNMQLPSTSVSSENPRAEKTFGETISPSLHQGETAFMKDFVFKQSTTDAEILWCLNIIMKNRSLNSVDTDIQILKKIASDSKIVEKMTLSSSKASYVICYGLAPYFKDQLDQNLQNCKKFVVCFDESLNKIAQKGQMDLLIRFFNEKTQQVDTRYLTSVFLQRAAAEDLVLKFKEGLGEHKLHNILQVRKY